jgi:hypothetical protein
MARFNTSGGYEQTTLDESASWGPTQCTAITDSSDKRCQHPTLPGATRCWQHADMDALAERVFDTADAVDADGSERLSRDLVRP